MNTKVDSFVQQLTKESARMRDVLVMSEDEVSAGLYELARSNLTQRGLGVNQSGDLVPSRGPGILRERSRQYRSRNRVLPLPEIKA